VSAFFCGAHLKQEESLSTSAMTEKVAQQGGAGDSVLADSIASSHHHEKDFSWLGPL
jgi:fructose-1-phosphate kinase PfkB-like protein